MAHTIWFENSHYEKLRTRLQAACSAQPVIRLRPVFQATTWASDPFILFQNGIRYQISDMFAMLENASLRIDAMVINHCLALKEWVMEFGHLVALYFLIQERVILPELNSLQPGICSITTLRQGTLPLIETLVRIHASTLRLESAIRQRDETGITSANDDMYESLRSMSELVFMFAVDCEKLFSWELATFVPVMQQTTTSCARDLQQRCIMDLLSFEDGERIFHAYSAHLPSDIRDYCLIGVDALRLRRIRSLERRWSRNHKAFRKQFASAKTG